MKKQICIVYEPCDEIKQGKSVITGDGSMIYVPSPSICPFSVYPYHWSFEIATSVVAENKYKLEHFLGNQVFLSCETAKLKKPTASAGCIYVEIDFPHADGVYYSDYEQFCKKKYYDPDNKILAIGDIYGEGKCIATVYKGNIIKNLIMDCQSYTKYRPNETTGGIFVSWRRKEELPTGA